MLFIIYLSISAGVIFSINGSDDSLPTVSSYCFARISVGERLIGYDATRIIERNTVGECEEECNVYKCTHFSFGTAAGGNKTCELTTEREISRTQDPNFDLYQRTDECTEGKPTGYEKASEENEGNRLKLGNKNRIIVNGKHHHGDRRLYLIQACYRRIITGKRLHERFIRHSLPCNSLQACQHQCSIEKHFTCQGFNIRLDPDRVGRGICELSSITTHPDLSRDFVFDPEFAYYERDYDNNLPNCGSFNAAPNVVASHNSGNAIGSLPPINGGPYYGGDSYGPWSTGHGTVDHGPWGSHGYGSGFYESNNPSRGPAPSFHPDTSNEQGPYSGYGHNYGYGGGSQGYVFQGERNPPKGSGPSFHQKFPFYPERHGFEGGSLPRDSRPIPQPIPSGQQGFNTGYGYALDYNYDSTGFYGKSNPPKGFQLSGRGGGRFYAEYPKAPDYEGRSPPAKYPIWGRRYDKTNRIPTYIIIDADTRDGYGEKRPDYSSYNPDRSYLPVGPPPVLPPRPLPPPPATNRPPSGNLVPFQQQPLRPFLPPQAQWQPSPPYSFVSEESNKLGISSNAVEHEVCFRREHPGYKLNTNIIRGMYETPTVLDCEVMCNNSPFKCTGYSFRYSASKSEPNCLLTDYKSLNRKTHLLPDRSCDVYFKMGPCMELERVGDTECFSKVATNRKLNPGKFVKILTVSAMSECEFACLSSEFFTCRSFSFRHGPSVIGEPVENCFLSDWPISALTNLDFIPQANHEVYERGSFGHGCELNVGPPYIGPRPPFAPYPNLPQITHAKDPWGIEDTWRHFTVNGWPCKAGTECELNAEAGFWACEVEGGDRAQWDYCCRPKHHCGFSRGYSYPWCFVGEAGPDQWRPCSEFYYPEFRNRYSYKPVKSHNPHPDDSYGPPRDTRPWNFGPEDFGPPSYWPISYIYAEPPPNETYIWGPEEQLFYHHNYEHYQEDPDNGPRIRFKTCGNKHPYPRAIIQKLDLKNIPKAGNPEEQLKKDEKPRVSKVESEPALGFSPENRDKKNSPNFFLSEDPITGNLTKQESNGTTVSLKKTKEIIQEVEKIIMENAAGTEPERNESLKKMETKHSGYFSVNLLEKKDFWN